jgi:hypothetical protein
MTNNKLHRTAQPDGQHHNTHPVSHLQHLTRTPPLNTTRPQPYCTLQQLTRAELITTARKTIAQLARTQHPYPNHIPNRYSRHFQRYFAPDAAFQHLLRHPSTPFPQTTPTPSPLMAPPSRAQVPTSQAPTGHPTPQTPPLRADCARHNASRGQAGLTTTSTPAVCPSIGCLPSHRTPATPTPPRAVPKSKAGLPVCSAYAHGSAWGGWTGGARWGGCRGRVQWAFGCQGACGVCSRLLEMADVTTRSISVSSG